MREDLKHIRNIFFYDFSAVEEEFGIDSFSMIPDYKAVKKNKKIYNRNVSEKITTEISSRRRKWIFQLLQDKAHPKAI
ncbi:MAG: hypothetical protein IJ784_03800 [Ruminiclostridium sp.]|nr:hypothetical protein [Ruminiclostridium sp.]